MSLRVNNNFESRIRILHFGDLHADAKLTDKSIFNGLKKFLKQEIGNLRPFDFAVFCGDIVQGKNGKLALSQKFEIAEKMIRQLMVAMALPANRIILVPGWHDTASSLSKDRIGTYFSSYLDFSNRFYEGVFSPINSAAPPCTIFRHFPVRRLWDRFSLRVIALNSCDYPKKSFKHPRKKYQHGVITPKQINLVVSTIGQDEIEDSFNIVVFHHASFYESGAPRRSDADSAARLFKPVKKLIPSFCLTGHWHYCTRASVEQGVLFYSSGRTCTIGEARGGVRDNQFNILELGIFGKKDIYGIRQRVIQWYNGAWREGNGTDKSYYFAKGVPNNLKEYFRETYINYA